MVHVNADRAAVNRKLLLMSERVHKSLWRGTGTLRSRTTAALRSHQHNYAPEANQILRRMHTHSHTPETAPIAVIRDLQAEAAARSIIQSEGNLGYFEVHVIALLVSSS